MYKIIPTLVIVVSICFISGCSSPIPSSNAAHQTVITDGDGYLIPTDMIIFRGELLDCYDSGTLIEVVTNKVGRKAFSIKYQSSEAISPRKVPAVSSGNDEDGTSRIIGIACTGLIPNHPKAYDIIKHGPRGENLPETGLQYYYPYYYKDDESKGNRTSE